MEEVLLIATSPRQGGNSDDAAQIVFDELKAKGCTAKLIHLHEHRIERCQGCLNCQRGEDCNIEDDFPTLWARVKAASTVVYFVPVYWCSPPGLMKDFVDRTVVDYEAGGVMRGQEVHLVSIAQAAGFGPQEEIVDTWLCWLGGSPTKTKLRLIAFHTGELVVNTRAADELKELAQRLAG